MKAINKFNLSDFGSVVGEYTVFFNPDNSIRNIEYKFEEGEIWNFTEVKEKVLEVVNSLNDNIQRILSYRKNLNLDDIKSLKRDPVFAQPYDHYDDQFIYDYISEDRRRYSFAISKDDKVMFTNNKVSIYHPKNDEIDYENDLSKYIYFNKEYIMTMEEDEAVYETTGYNILRFYYIFKDFVKKSDDKIYLFPTLQLLPTEVYNGYTKKPFFRIEYDNDGIVSKVINVNDMIQELSRYESVDTRTYSVHPLLFDGFDFRLIYRPFAYYALDVLDKGIGDYHIFTRKIYQINNPEFLINYIYMINTTRFMFDKLIIEE